MSGRGGLVDSENCVSNQREEGNDGDNGSRGIHMR